MTNPHDRDARPFIVNDAVIDALRAEYSAEKCDTLSEAADAYLNHHRLYAEAPSLKLIAAAMVVAHHLDIAAVLLGIGEDGSR